MSTLSADVELWLALPDDERLPSSAAVTLAARLQEAARHVAGLIAEGSVAAASRPTERRDVLAEALQVVLDSSWSDHPVPPPPPTALELRELARAGRLALDAGIVVDDVQEVGA